jgi:hypothetical protein
MHTTVEGRGSTAALASQIRSLCATRPEILSYIDRLKSIVLVQHFLSILWEYERKMLLVMIKSCMYTATLYNCYEYSLLRFHQYGVFHKIIVRLQHSEFLWQCSQNKLHAAVFAQRRDDQKSESLVAPLNLRTHSLSTAALE